MFNIIFIDILINIEKQINMKSFLFSQLRERWSNFINEPKTPKFDIDSFIKFSHLKYLENNGFAYALLNNVSFEIEHCSENFYDVLGLDEINFKRNGTSEFIEAIDRNQSNYFILLPHFFEEYWQNMASEKRKDIIRKTIGLNFKHNQKGIIRLAIQTHILEVNSLQAPTYLFVIYQDITYLMKDDFYWLRFAHLDKTEKVLVYHDGYKEVLKDDIISPREKEILKLIVEGKSTDEIADSLFISRITVNNHRQNMLNRVGAKDTTGLITISKICQLV
jgi:DNA-binding CsgD family transcriptional regulator